MVRRDSAPGLLPHAPPSTNPIYQPYEPVEHHQLADNGQNLATNAPPIYAPPIRSSNLPVKGESCSRGGGVRLTMSRDWRCTIVDFQRGFTG